MPDVKRRLLRQIPTKFRFHKVDFRLAAPMSTAVHAPRFKFHKVDFRQVVFWVSGSAGLSFKFHKVDFGHPVVGQHEDAVLPGLNSTR